MRNPLDDYADVVNALPWLYAYMSLLGIIASLYAIAWGYGDRGLFGSRYYRDQMIRGIGDLLWCIAMLWPVPLVRVVANMARRWKLAEYEWVTDYDESRRGR